MNIYIFLFSIVKFIKYNKMKIMEETMSQM